MILSLETFQLTQMILKRKKMQMLLKEFELQMNHFLINISVHFLKN